MIRRPGTPTRNQLAGAAAWLFVGIWSSGFVVARGITGLIDPYLFLLLRFACVLILFGITMLVMRAALPSRRDCWRLVGIGALMQGFYLGPGFWAVSQGLEAGVMALIGTMQPPLTAVLAWYFLNERISTRTIVGLLTGIAGVALAVAPGLYSQTGSQADGLAGSTAVSLWVILAAMISISSITAGTLLQKSSIVSVPLLSAITFQTLGAVAVMGVMTATLGHWQFVVSLETLAFLAYAVVVLSIGGFTLFTWLLRSGSATRTSSLLLIVPPLAAILTWLLYDEALGIVQISGFALALLGVLLARSGPPVNP